MKHKIYAICMIVVMLTILSACTSEKRKDVEEIKLTQKQEEDLMEQYAENDECHYDEYLPSVRVASCEVFGAECEAGTNKGYVYAYVLDGEYVNFKDTAYEQSGGHMPVKITVQFAEDSIKLLGSEVMQEGDDLEEALKKMFPRKYYLKCKKYEANHADGYEKLQKKQEEKIREIWGIPISEKYSLQLSEDGTYEVVWLEEAELPEESKLHIIERGKLERCKSRK